MKQITVLEQEGSGKMAQSLIERLQLGAVDGSAPITDLLRRAKLAAVNLRTVEFTAWVDLEVKGYEGDDTIPPYRRVQGVLKFLNPIHGWRPVLGTEGLETEVRQPIGDVFALSHSPAGFVTQAVPHQIQKMVFNGLGFQCDVKLHVGANEMSRIIEAVRNSVLDWTLKLEAAGVHGHGLSFTPEEAKAAQNMNITNNYHGPVGSVAHGNNRIGKVSQTNASATPQEIADAINSLLAAMAAAGVRTGGSDAATADLAAAEVELRSGRVPFGNLSKALRVLNDAEDIALRAPEVASKFHTLWQMFGGT
jgi:hypothetical protein